MDDLSDLLSELESGPSRAPPPQSKPSYSSGDDGLDDILSQLSFTEKKDKIEQQMDVHLPDKESMEILNQDYPAPDKTVKPVKKNDESFEALLGELEGKVTSPKPVRQEPVRQDPPKNNNPKPAQAHSITFEEIMPQPQRAVVVTSSAPSSQSSTPSSTPASYTYTATPAKTNVSYTVSSTPSIPEVSVVPEPGFTIQVRPATASTPSPVSQSHQREDGMFVSRGVVQGSRTGTLGNDDYEKLADLLKIRSQTIEKRFKMGPEGISQFAIMQLRFIVRYIDEKFQINDPTIREGRSKDELVIWISTQLKGR